MILQNIQNTIRQSHSPFIIAGPCSVETENRLYETVAALSKIKQVQLIRAGVWKPRTRPGSFQGIGEMGLEWIQQVKSDFQIPFCVEVANAKHVELALKANIDVLWIGARTTVNPFAVQDIVNALKGVQIPVLIKNPVNPDTQLWIGAFERFKNAGLTDLVAIHRGFSIYKHPKYRNVPRWEIPIALKEEMPDIPIICDPSHITGNSNLIEEVSQKALDLAFDGLMIETHPTPKEAWSDKEQQITPHQLEVILSNLKKRDNYEKDYELPLNQYRAQVDQLDEGLFDILYQRMKISNQISEFKKEHNLPILSVQRWKEMIDKRLGHSSEEMLSEDFIRAIMDAIHQESIRHQNKVMNEESKTTKTQAP